MSKEHYRRFTDRLCVQRMPISRQQLALELNVSERTIARYIDRLKQSDVVIEVSQFEQRTHRGVAKWSFRASLLGLVEARQSKLKLD
jgi:predicted ArsR family transcriptional regulator